MAYEYMVGGKKVVLPIQPDKVAVRFKEPAPQATRAAVIDPIPEVGSFAERYEVPNEKFTVVDVTPPSQPGPQAGPQRVAAATAALTADQEVARVAPVFNLGSSQAIATDRIMVGFKQGMTKARAKTVVESISPQGVDSLEEIADGEYMVKLNETVDPFDVIGKLMKDKSVKYAEPDFVIIGKHVPRNVPGGMPAEMPGETIAPTFKEAAIGPAAPSLDALLAKQYAVALTRAKDAWQLLSGKAAIKIAVLDEGVDTKHADLKGRIVGTYDALSRTANQQPNAWDGHGTACAGLAAAIPNKIGVRGIGGGCSILAVRIAYSPSNGANWVTSNSAIQEAIDWAWKNGADVLSNSWGGGAPSNAIINAFERARTKGRSGKGCVVVIAAGNESGPVSFPGTLPKVLTVSASNEADEPKTKTSSDGEFWWGSNFGPEVDVAAPGVHNYTTDISGNAGYNPGNTSLNGDYVSNFNGTSSATPIVAGAAALVLSAAPNLTESQVRSILKTTADKVGTVVYSAGRNDQMGNGRVNVLKAVKRAMTMATP
jgi:thermitase